MSICRLARWSRQRQTAGLAAPARLLLHRSGSTRADFFVPSYNAAAVAEMVQAKYRNAQGGVTHKHSKRRKVDHGPSASVWRQGSNEEVLAFEVDELLQRPKLSASGDYVTHGESGGDWSEVELVIEHLSSTGDGLARSEHGHVSAIPFCLPGERVLARVRKAAKGAWSNGDLVRVLEPSALREGVTPGCKHFATCSGCQFQMLPYAEQLAHKKRIVERAFRNFSDLPPDVVPDVQETGASPLQYGYRTKLTPHFDRPARPKGAASGGSSTPLFTEVPPIGFGKKGYRHVMDIENCPLGTPIVQEGMRSERARVAANIASYKAGATLLLRESTKRVSNSDDNEVVKFTPSKQEGSPLLTMPTPSRIGPTVSTADGPQHELYYDDDDDGAAALPYHDVKTCITAPNALTTEYISTSSLRFDTRASSFFQNNNSILPSFLTRLRAVAQPASTAGGGGGGGTDLKYLLDAYCGSGLLSLSLSPLFLSVLGIEIDGSSVAQATANARLNGLDNCGFIEADAADLFADVPYPPAQTVLVIDPPRKGCSVEFLRQMLRWGPARVCYVSCNVHTLARDVGWMVRGGRAPAAAAAAAAAAETPKTAISGLWDIAEHGEAPAARSDDGPWHAYRIESLQGWDFFPQTGHVEGLCVLNRVTASPSPSKKRATSASRSRSPKRQQQSSSTTTSIWEAIKDEVEEQQQVRDKKAQK